MPSWSSHVSIFANSSFGFSSFLQQIWFFDGHLPSSDLMKTSLNLTPDFDFPPNLSKHWPFSTHLKPSFLNSVSEQSWITLSSWQQTPGSAAALGSFQGFIKGSLLVSGTPEAFKILNEDKVGVIPMKTVKLFFMVNLQYVNVANCQWCKMTMLQNGEMLMFADKLGRWGKIMPKTFFCTLPNDSYRFWADLHLEGHV